MSKILIVDDEESIRVALAEILEFENFKVETAENGKIGLELLRNQEFDLAFCDIKMPEMDGLEMLEKLKAEGIETPIIMISGHGNIETAVDSIKKGAFDFIQKPLDLNRILVTIRNGLDKKELQKETKILRKKVSAKSTEGSPIVGESEAIKDILGMINKIAPTDARVLITGENGCGKELVARQIHENSPRAKKPFVEVNCAAIPTELIESILFGHEKGSFTGAHKQSKGKFEQAEEGTLFLDEVGDMSLSAQAKVLRALQESKITRVGGESDIKVNVRVIAATNKNLKQEIANGNFREDLYHRLSVIPLQVPPLRERKSDIPILARFFLKNICEEQELPQKKFAPEALEALQQGAWTGNIRELRNVVERLIILAATDEISADEVKKYALAN
ncbi:MAG: sigma-54-dependent transcriptional regulator [Luteibaculaceae bacterium]